MLPSCYLVSNVFNFLHKMCTRLYKMIQLTLQEYHVELQGDCNFLKNKLSVRPQSQDYETLIPVPQ